MKKIVKISGNSDKTYLFLQKRIPGDLNWGAKGVKILVLELDNNRLGILLGIGDDTTQEKN